MRSLFARRLAATAAAVLGLHGAAFAQAQASAAVPVPGSEIRSWMEAGGMPVAGVSLANGCFFLARSVGLVRYQTLHCGAQSPFSVQGEASVQGDQLCSRFTYPDGTVLDRCQDVFRIGENKYQLRVQNQPTTVFYRVLH